MKSSSIIYAFPYPALEAGNLSFPGGEYKATAEMASHECAVEITHEISGAPFLEELIANGEAKFGCVFSIPKVGIRKLLLSETHKQIVSWKKSDMGEPPKLRPVLLYTGADKEFCFEKNHGVADIWVKRKITIPTGARLARANFLHINSSDYQFIRFHHAKEYENGTFDVKEGTEDGFFFTTYAATDVFNLVRSPGKNNPLRDAILTSIVCRCFTILQNDYKENEEDSIESFSNLKILQDKLQNEIGSDWSDPDFDPIFAATKLYPINIHQQIDEGDE